VLLIGHSEARKESGQGSGRSRGEAQQDRDQEDGQASHDEEATYEAHQ
jgi:hypothetical protein